MKKLFLMGRSEAGKTSLTQALKGDERLIWKVDIVENASAKECVRQLLFRV